MHLKAFFLSAIIIFFSLNLSAQKNKNEPLNNGIDRPKLVIGIVVDQMRWDYLYRYYNRYSEGGFKRLMKKGYSFENIMLPYTPAVTAAGHTCIYTGSVPSVHGVVGNDWVERSTGEKMYCAQDKSVQSVGTFSDRGQMSPRNMLVTTIGDELRFATNNRSRVFGVSLKDRAAIFPAGHSANAAYWLDDSTGNWISSSFYMKQLPQWVTDFNNERKPDSLLNKPWTLLYADDVYDQSVPEDSLFARSSIYEPFAAGFPHRINTKGGKDYEGFRATPFGNTISIDFAEQLMNNEKLGFSGQTDMLCLSLSSTDYVGHRFGPQSKEIEDTYLRLDKDLESFFSYLDKTIGEGKYIIFLSADHGAVQTPVFLRENKLPGGAITGTTLLKDINAQLFTKYKVKNLLQNYFEYQLFFNHARLDSAGINAAEAEDFVVDQLKKRTETANAFSYRNFDHVILPDFLRKKLEYGYYAKRSGDVQFIVKPGYVDTQLKGTDHGTWLPYDAHIPLLFYGWNIKHGSTNRETYMTDIAPTIAALLHVQVPSGSVGKVLAEVAP